MNYQTPENQKKIETYIAELEQLLSQIENDDTQDIEKLLENVEKAITIIQKCDEKMESIETRVIEIKQKIAKVMEEDQ